MLEMLDNKVGCRAGGVEAIADGFELPSFSKMLFNLLRLRSRHYIIALLSPNYGIMQQPICATADPTPKGVAFN